MQLSFAGERLLAVVAHPDDADYYCAGTLARAKADGAAIGILVLCQGDKGQPATPIPNLAALRRKEMSAAAKLLGAELFFGRVPDGHLADAPPLRRIAVEACRRFEPTLLLAHHCGRLSCRSPGGRLAGRGRLVVLHVDRTQDPSPGPEEPARLVVDGHNEYDRFRADVVRRHQPHRSMSSGGCSLATARNCGAETTSRRSKR